ncbi:MAG: amidohydrolase family protein [Desulfobacteraceae bacterium]|nr:amidohydrolase family protein [Desulfobacteraceae bacterium]
MRMATLNNAQLLGLERDLGSIEPGKIADLAVFEKNPLETFQTLSNRGWSSRAGNWSIRPDA